MKKLTLILAALTVTAGFAQIANCNKLTGAQRNACICAFFGEPPNCNVNNPNDVLISGLVHFR